MITVKTPDGGTAQFPDGTPPDVIKQALRKRFPAPQSPEMKQGLSELSGMTVAPKVAPRQEADGTVLSALRGGLQGATFGASDEILAGLLSLHPKIDYDTALNYQRDKLDANREANPVSSIGGEIAGAIAAPVGAVGTAGSLGLRALKSAGVTGALSGLYGFNAGEGGFGDRADSAIKQGALGAGIGAAIPVIGTVLQRAMDGRALSRAVKAGAKGAPSTDEAFAIANRAYDEVDNAGVQIAPGAFDDARAAILEALRTKTGFDELPGPGSLTPNSARVNEIMGQASARMADDPTSALPFRAVDQMRRQAGAAAGNVANKSDQKAGMTIIEGLDDLVNGLDETKVVAGDFEALQSALPKARKAYTTASRSQLIEDAIEAGGDYLSGASSGIRNQFKNILRNPRLARSFSDAEKAAMRRVINGSIPEQMLNMIGGGLGQLAQVGVGLGLGGPIGGLVGAAGAAAARKGAEAVTRSKAEIVRALIANGGIAAMPRAETAVPQIAESLMRRLSATALQQR